MEPPEPPPPPDEAIQRLNVPPSVELEGEREELASSVNALTGAETDASGAPIHVEDARKRPKKLHNASVHISERSEQGEENSPDGAPDEPDEPDGETAVRDGTQRAQGRPTGIRDERVVETNTLRRGIGPGGHRGEQVATGDVERDWKRQNDVEGVGCDWNGDRKGGATSAARRDSKRVETDALAAYQEDQHEQRQQTTSDVPEPSNPPHNYPRRPHTHPNPPRRRGRLKTKPTRVSQSRTTYQIIRVRRSRIGRI